MIVNWDRWEGFVNIKSNWVDCAKAIGIVLVVYGHVARGVYNAGINVPARWYGLIDSAVYSFHMPLFFFLSGLFFLRTFERRGSIGLLNSKIDTIVYPYVLWSVLQGCMEVALSNYTNGNVRFGDVLALFWEPRAQFWFLYALFLVFFVCDVFLSIFSLKSSYALFLIAVVLYLIQGYLPDVLLIEYLAQSLVFFMFGVLFMRHLDVERVSRGWALFFICLCFVVAQWFFHGYLSLHYYDRGVASLLLGFVSILFVVGASGFVARFNSGIVLFIGSSSMAIYLMHVVAGSGVRVLLKRVVGVDSFAIHIVVGCIVGVLAPLIAVYVINRLNIRYVFSAPLSGGISKILRLNGK
jgi:fucose 4-O-acetylase-like acetyltransferase